MTVPAPSVDQPADRVDHVASEALLHQAAGRLAVRFAGIFNEQTVERLLRESYQGLYRTARVKQYLPVLAERFARERLTALAQVEGALAKEVPEVLLVCVQNAGRSQLAAALIERYAAGRVHVRSAGSLPAADVDAGVVTVLGEIGIDAAEVFPKPLTDDVVQAADVVVTMGCGDACPVYPGKRYVDWVLPDPAGASLETVRVIRDDIDRRVRALVDELLGQGD